MFRVTEASAITAEGLAFVRVLRREFLGRLPSVNSTMHCFRASAGLTSGIGPIYVGIAYAPSNVVNVYFQFGRPF